MSERLLTLLSIAGSDSVGGAGIQADIRVGADLGIHVATAVTIITAQNSRGVKESRTVSPDLLKFQLDAISEDLTPDAVKIGMIGSTENMDVISDFLISLPPETPVIVDPVLKISANSQSHQKSQCGTKDWIGKYLTKIFPVSTVVTPNLDELKLLTGSNLISNRTLFDLNSQNAVIKGGHGKGATITDILLTPEEQIEMTHSRIKCQNLHGTGCVFSSYLASYMAMGDSLKIAFQKTCRQLFVIISKSTHYTLGRSVYGPLNINENYFTYDNSIQQSSH